jgi:hypothetical protein
MAFNGWYNRLYTVTGQVSRAPATAWPNACFLISWIDSSNKCCCLSRCTQYIDDDDSEKYRPQIEKVRQSCIDSVLFCSLFFFSDIGLVWFLFFSCPTILQAVRSFRLT